MTGQERIILLWVYLTGDPSVRTEDLFGAILTWIKALSLLSLAAWVVSWILIGIKEGVVGRGSWYDYLAVAALILTPVTVLLRVLEQVGRLTAITVGSTPLTTIAIFTCVLLYGVWAEITLVRTLGRYGKKIDLVTLAAAHLALAFGLVAGVYIQQRGLLVYVVPMLTPNKVFTWSDGLAYGATMGLTYMGYLVFLRVAAVFFKELIAIRGRRLYAIARLSIFEANRRMWAPWVVITVFVLVLAFTHWFLQAPRAAEMGRLYVGTLTLLVSVLLTAMVTILTPLSIPTDIQQQTIYTVVSKPVRRLELIWGRMIGYMALVTLLVAVFGLISLGYLRRTVGNAIDTTEAAAVKAKKENKVSEFKALAEQADQLRTRMQARVPIKGSLSFLDSRGIPHAMGIDVGQDQSMREPRSHIEGATPSAAIWRYGRNIPDPFSRPGQPVHLVDRPIPVEELLKSGTVEATLDQVYRLEAQLRRDQQAKAQPDLSASVAAQLNAAIERNQTELNRVRADFDRVKKAADDLQAKVDQADAAGDAKQATAARAELARISSPPVTVEMSFNVYRTTKGKVGEAVYAELLATNLVTGGTFEADVFPIKEYYTNRVRIPASLLAGSQGEIKLEVHCLTATQYLGMAESDLYILLPPRNFGVNYMKGLFGVWLQAMVLTAIGVCAGTFLSWPVALLTTIAFFIAGQLAFAFLVDFTRQAVLGGGPFESLIRLLTHDNQMTDLTPTAGVVLAKTLDSLVMPLMSLLVYIVPNFKALDVSNMVADGYDVSWTMLGVNTLLAIAYALPFSVAAYFILKNREVAA
jgi:ABC-type transport system involved in multi-copper enzyme maturation permease subunit